MLKDIVFRSRIPFIVKQTYCGRGTLEVKAKGLYEKGKNEMKIKSEEFL